MVRSNTGPKASTTSAASPKASSSREVPRNGVSNEMPATFKRKPPFAESPTGREDGNKSERSGRANPQGSSGSVSSSSMDDFGLISSKPPVDLLAADAVVPTTSSSSSVGSHTPRLGSKHHYGVLQDEYDDAEDEMASVRSGSTRHATRGQHFYAKLDDPSEHFDESLFLKPLSGDGFVYVDPEGNDSVRSANSIASGASSTRKAGHRAAKSSQPGADPEKGLPLEEDLNGQQQQQKAFVVRKRGLGMRLYIRFCHFTPMLFIGVLVLGFAWLCSFDRPLALAILTVYCVHHAWCHLFHVAGFSWVGQSKMSAAEQQDYAANHQEWLRKRNQAKATKRAKQERKREKNSRNNGKNQSKYAFVSQDEDDAEKAAASGDNNNDSNGDGDSYVAWSDVRHFVILPNYKEDPDILREAIDSCAAFSLARTHMGFVLAMEAREPNVESKANELIAEYQHKFKYIFATYHPPGLPNEMPGKASNTRWAAQRLWDFMKTEDLHSDRCVLTISDADSEFQEKYFDALTQRFAEKPKSKRDCTVWQAPILHYKNYHSQPAIVQLTSMFIAQHELANLADKTSTALPYSTYSITSNLAYRVGGWDPDWISEDWHMFLKCFLHTSDTPPVRVEGIFLPVMNYTPEDSTYWKSLLARWEQSKRHALGISEMVYFFSTLPDSYAKVMRSKKGCCNWGPTLTFFKSSTQVAYKILVTHIEMGTYWLLGAANGPLIWWLYRHPAEMQASCLGAETAHAWLMFNVKFSLVSSVIFFAFNFLNVALYEHARPRAVPFPPGSKWRWIYQCSAAHYVLLFVATITLAPILGIAGGYTAWRAAYKCAKSHKFEYVVALKPVAAKKKLESSAKA